MRFSTIGYCIKQGFKNIWRNKLFSLASMATMSACIFMFGIFFCIVQNFQYFVKSAEEGVAITVLFDEGTTEDQIMEIGKDLTKREGVSEVVYVSADEAWKSYQKTYFQGDESMVTYIESIDGVRKVNRSDQVADMLSGFNRLVSYVSIAVIGLLLAVSVFLISNTVATGIAVRKEEIAIMRLIGAKNIFIEAPFLIEGVIIGLVGAALPLVVLYYLYHKVILYVAEEFNMLTSVMKFLPVNELFSTLLPVGMLLGVGIGFFGSIVTSRRHLRV